MQESEVSTIHGEVHHARAEEEHTPENIRVILDVDRLPDTKAGFFETGTR